jgi:hypothetical protein
MILKNGMILKKKTHAYLQVCISFGVKKFNYLSNITKFAYK